MKLIAATFGRHAWGQAIRSVTILPKQLLKLSVATTHGRYSEALRYLCGVGLGLAAWFIALLSIQAFVDSVFYPLVDAQNLQNSWGGPTLAGAWSTHFLLYLITIPIQLWILRGLVMLNILNQPSQSHPKHYWWALPLSCVLTVGVAALLVAWIHQL